MLLGLVLTGLLPALGVGGIAAWQAAKGWQEVAEARLHETARALSLAVASELERHRSAAAVLALSDSLKAPEPDLWTFDAQARRAGAALGAPVVLLDTYTNRQLVNTALPPGQSEAISGLDTWPAQEPGRPAMANLATGSLLGRPVVGVAVPVALDGRARYTLAVLLQTDRLNRLFASQTLPGDSFAVLTDSSGAIVAASTPGSDLNLARASRPGGARAVPTRQASLRHAEGGDGIERVYASLPVDGTPGWALVVAQSATEFNEPWRGPLLTLALGGYGVLCVAGALASLTARGVLVPLARLSRHARDFAEGGLDAATTAASLPAVGIAELEALRQGFGKAEATLAARGAALAESKFRFRAVAAAVPAFLFAADANGRVTYTNERFQGYAGVPAAGLLDSGWLGVLHPSDRDRASAAWSQALRSGQPFEVEFRFRAADGSHRWFLGRGAPMRDTEARIVGWFGACTDIQDIVDAREVLTRDNGHLEDLVEARTRALQDAQGRLVHAQRMEAVGRLTAGVAHDFNNVLLTLMSGLEFALEEGTDPAEAREDLQIALGAAQRGARLTSHLLSFSRQQVLRPDAVDVSSLLHELRHTLARTLGREVLLRVEAEPGLHVLVDADHLNSALLNLALNAHAAMPGGGVITLEAHAAAEEVPDGRADGRADGRVDGRVVVAVADTGEGMPPDVRAKACEPFFTTKGLKGSGLGLSMVQGFAAQSGGEMRLHSEVGKGTRVELVLPRGVPPIGRPVRGGNDWERKGRERLELCVEGQAGDGDHEAAV